MSGNPFGKDVSKHGSDDWVARKGYDESRAARHPPPSPSPRPAVNVSSSSNNFTSSVTRGRQSSQRSSASSGGFIKFLSFVAVAVGVIAYLGSKSDSSRRTIPENDASARTSDPQPPPRTLPTSNVKTATEDTSAAPADSVITWKPLLSTQDIRVTAAVNDLKALSRENFFVNQVGNELVLQGGHTPEGLFSQTSFNVANLDLQGTSYSENDSSLSVSCKSGSGCIYYALYDPGADANNPPLKQRGMYGSLGIHASSRDDAIQILADLQRLQSLAR